MATNGEGAAPEERTAFERLRAAAKLLLAETPRCNATQAHYDLLDAVRAADKVLCRSSAPSEATDEP